jgi:hypothetical protein
MVVYEGAAYYSEVVVADEAGTLPKLVVEIFESTSDDSDIKAESYHLVLGWAQGGLSVVEIYSLSNLGDRTVTGAIVLDDGREATASYSIPQNAANLSFPSSSADRFIALEGRYADTRPLTPGIESGQVVASYILPYDDPLSLVRTLPFDVDEIRVFFPYALEEMSVELLEGEYIGVETIGSSSQAYEVYSLGPLTKVSKLPSQSLERQRLRRRKWGGIIHQQKGQQQAPAF